MYEFVSIFHHDETLFHSFIKPTTFWTLFLSFSLLYALCVYSMSSEQVLCALMYEVKWMSKNPPSTTAIVSNRKLTGRTLCTKCTESVPAVPAVPTVPAEEI